MVFVTELIGNPSIMISCDGIRQDLVVFVINPSFSNYMNVSVMLRTHFSNVCLEDSSHQYATKCVHLRANLLKPVSKL